jgi:hypothetical protein
LSILLHLPRTIRQLSSSRAKRWKGTEFGVAVDSKRIVTKLKQLGFVPAQDGDDGANFVMPLSELDRVAGVVRPLRKPGGRR